MMNLKSLDSKEIKGCINNIKQAVALLQQVYELDIYESRIDLTYAVDFSMLKDAVETLEEELLRRG